MVFWIRVSYGFQSESGASGHDFYDSNEYKPGKLATRSFSESDISLTVKGENQI